MFDPNIEAEPLEKPDGAGTLPSKPVELRDATLSWQALTVLFILGVSVGGFLLPELHDRLSWPLNLLAFYFLTSNVALLLVIGVAIWLRPRILMLSNLRPKWEDAGWLATGFLVNSLPLPFVPVDINRGIVWLYVLTFVFYDPILEEIVCRGMFLRSLVERFSRPLKVICIALVAALLHPNAAGFLLQLVLCIIYVYRGNSLSASIACRAGANLAALVFLSRVV